MNQLREKLDAAYDLHAVNAKYNDFEFSAIKLIRDTEKAFILYDNATYYSDGKMSLQNFIEMFFHPSFNKTTVKVN